MKKNITAAVLGGDERQARLACILAREGYSVRVYGTDDGFCDAEAFGIERYGDAVSAVSNADAVIFPLPSVKNGIYLNEKSDNKTPISDILDALPCGGAVFSGKTDSEFEKMCLSRGLSHTDYYKKEEFTIKNAHLTAEGALHIFTNEKRCAVLGSRILVIGSGRVAKCTARVFSSLGSEVTMMARSRAELAWAELLGYKTADLYLRGERLAVFSKHYDAIINTVPVTFIVGETLRAIPKGTFYIELASAPYGIDENESRLCGIRVLRAPAIPGKYAPESAAEIIYSVISEDLSECGGKL